MPIKGLSETRRLPRIGKIHLGVRVKEKGKAEYPRATQYFVFDPEHPKYKELVETFGEKPTELRILIPVEDEERFASQYYKLYSRTRGLVCKGDGETCVRMVDKDTGALANRNSKNVEMRDMTCQGRDCPDYGPRGCGEVMNLQFLLPEVSGFGVWQIDTGSVNSILNINSALELIRSVYGRVSMVPLILALEPKEVTNPDDGKKKTVRVLNIRSMDKMLEAYRKASMPPLELLQGIEGETELPESDTAPFIDLPVAETPPPENKPFPEETAIAETVSEQEAQTEQLATQVKEKLEEEKAQSDTEKLWDELDNEEAEADMGQESKPIIDTPITKEKIAIAMAYLKSKGRKEWSNANVVSYLKSITGREASSVRQALDYLDEAELDKFCTKVNEAVGKY